MSDEKVIEQTGEVDPTTGAPVTPEEGTTVESAPEEKPVETEEQKSEKFFEKRHQGMMEKLTARFGPEVVQELKDDQFASEQPSVTPTSEEAKPTESFDPDDVVTVAMQQQMQQQSEKRILDALDARDVKKDQKQQQASLQTQYTDEWNEADIVIKTLVGDLKIPEDVRAQIFAEVNGYNIPMKQLGGPSGYARAFYRLAQGYKASPTPPAPPGSTPEEIAALDKVRQVGLMTQPAGVPIGSTPVTTQQQAADAICPDDEPRTAT